MLHDEIFLFTAYGLYLLDSSRLFENPLSLYIVMCDQHVLSNMMELMEIELDIYMETGVMYIVV